jgi:hypothetical protein
VCLREQFSVISASSVQQQQQQRQQQKPVRRVTNSTRVSSLFALLTGDVKAAIEARAIAFAYSAVVT